MKFRKKGGDGSDIKCWSGFSQLGEKDRDKFGNRLFELSAFLNLIVADFMSCHQTALMSCL